MLEFINITKALADENRVRILLALNGRDELCVCQLFDMLQLAPSTVSKHLFILSNARLIYSRKEARWIYYGLNKEGRRRP
jgi:DNA-binding transcriptional ArsR family regulator